MATTKKPTGVTIKRDGNLKFVVTWKVADRNYSRGQQVRFRGVKSTGKTQAWTLYNVASGTTTKTHSLVVANWSPNSSQVIKYLEVQVRGKKSGASWSAWTKKTMNLYAPLRPTVTNTLDATNVTTFEWKTDVSDTSNRPFVRDKWQSFLAQDCTETDGSKLKWDAANTSWAENTGSATGTQTFTENSTVLASGSHTRWFRIRSQGAAGGSGWLYSKHVYATPYAPVIKSATATDDGSYTTVVVSWQSQIDAAHPIDESTLQYYIGTPTAADLVYSGSSWTDATTVQATGNDAAQFVISDVLGVDECLYVRAVNTHDSNNAYSANQLVTVGQMAAPTLTSVTVDSTNYRLNVQASNNSSVPGSAQAVIFRSEGVDLIVGIIPNGSTTLNNIQCPVWPWDIAVGVKAFVGAYTAIERTDGVSVYTIQKDMYSSTVWRSGDVSMEAGNVTAVAASDAIGEVILTWDWSWSSANQVEISWSDNKNAWESTQQPETYVIGDTYAARWRVSGLETGKTWYFSVRLMSVTDSDSVVYGDYCDPIAVDLSSAPRVPVFALSNPLISTDGVTTATWDYASTDGTMQTYAEIYSCTMSGGSVTSYDTLVATAQTAYNVEISGGLWTAGSTVHLAVRVTSASGVTSEFSDPVSLYIADELICTIDSTSLVSATIPGMTNTVNALTAMPFTATVLGAGEGGTTTLIIERADEYHMERPDGSKRDGYDGETILIYRQAGSDTMTITKDDLIGSLDDGATYRLIATVEDGYGQSDSEEITFVVKWTHQAGIPGATVTTEDDVAIITATAPATYEEGDTVDIYRLSADKPQLIVQGGDFGTAYVDPFPTLGEHGGYRCVCITADGDYITADNRPAWVDVTDTLFNNATGFIDFDGESIPIQYNVRLSNNWGKDFKETKYLGGSVKGDWNPAISRKSTVNVSMPTSDADITQALRRLSEYSGLCHVRTQDGSCFTADVQASAGVGYDSAGKNSEYTLTITRVEPEELDGIAYDDWAVG